MMLADFSRIVLLHRTHDHDENEPPIMMADLDPGDIGLNPFIPSEDYGMYDLVWGYFVFGQSVMFEYESNAEVYTSAGEFRIKGAFTINAEYPPPSGNMDASVPDDDIARFDKVKIKYEALAKLFKDAALSLPPDDNVLYGTIDDKRCVMLPEFMVDEKGKKIYARPVSLRILETQWPNLILYEAVLSEIESIRAKLTVNKVILDGGVVSINARKAMVKIQGMMFANSADVYFSGWEPRTYNVNGSIPDVAPSGYVGTWRIANSFNHLETGKVDIGKWVPPSGYIPGGGVHTVLYPSLFMDSSNIPFASAETGGQGTRIIVNAKE